MPDQVPITELFKRLNDKPNEEFFRQVWEFFRPRVVGLARKNLSPGESQLDGDDVAQLVSKSLWRKLGGFQCEDRKGIWRLLAAMTVVKVRQSIRWSQADMRDISREKQFSTQSAAEPVAAAEFEHSVDDIVEELIQTIEQREPSVAPTARLYLNGLDKVAIAEQRDIAPRTVDRHVERTKAIAEDWVFSIE